MENQADRQKYFDVLKVLIVALFGFAFVMGVFSVGIWVGQKRAEFSFRWLNSYHRNFGGPQGGFLDNFPNSNLMGGHGIFGVVIGIYTNNLIIKDQDNMEKIVVISTETIMRNNVGNMNFFDIKINDRVVIIGSPNGEGQVEAKFIRVLPPVTSFIKIIEIF
ncbi:MAG: hypothetical protein A3D44_04265 [Candidatus Staskawiczbacteria bacterium RIFCSPHIGHO2_02_FULL_42_22]|uniref:DUF5666 domain-containing protein n=1 Tax=Candidatus Staskawiczbacteria bacterium RIFCSPHIGHO2_02_FULL_42_22 TaxID=1802207 RepID=A0A1G2I486_9BACT|nr:MAG: hypothetical protein A3D44_04265 [Candidatus Staskawiczbacteria bacterium RIFCSPHIGHO2_02_FULL_42_22]